MIIFVHASSREAVLSDLLALARVLKIAETLESVLEWFERSSSWLLILDNVEDLAAIRDFLPKQGGSFLLTMRARPGRAATVVDLSEMILEEAVPFLLRRAGVLASKTEHADSTSTVFEQAKTICEVLDGLPLALDQAGAYIEKTKCGLGEYLQKLQTRERSLLLGKRGRPDDHPEPVATTWSLSFERVALLNPASADLLSFCAFLAPDAIPMELAQAFLGGDALVLGGALSTLTAFSFVGHEPTLQMISIHRLVQLVIRGALASDERRLWVQRVLRIVLLVFPQEDTGAFWSEAQRLLPQVEALATILEEECLTSENAGTLLNMAGLCATRQAQYLQAERLLRAALGQRRVVLGEAHPDVAESLNDLGLLYYSRGNLAQADLFFRQSLAMQRRLAVSEHLAITLNNVASLC